MASTGNTPSERASGLLNPAPVGGLPPDCAPRADRLMRFSPPEGELAWRLTNQNGFSLDLPPGFRIVGSHVDAATERVVFVIRSEAFPRIARGAPIPEIRLAFNGLKWRKNWD